MRATNNKALAVAIEHLTTELRDHRAETKEDFRELRSDVKVIKDDVADLKVEVAAIKAQRETVKDVKRFGYSFFVSVAGVLVAIAAIVVAYMN